MKFVSEPDDHVRLLDQDDTVTKMLMRACVLSLVNPKDDPDADTPEGLLLFRRAFAGDPEAVGLIREYVTANGWR